MFKEGVQFALPRLFLQSGKVNTSILMSDTTNQEQITVKTLLDK